MAANRSVDIGAVYPAVFAVFKDRPAGGPAASGETHLPWRRKNQGAGRRKMAFELRTREDDEWEEF